MRCSPPCVAAANCAPPPTASRARRPAPAPRSTASARWRAARASRRSLCRIPSVQRPSGSLREPLVTFAAATALAALCALVGLAVPLIRDNLSLSIAVIFFYAPAVAARAVGRRFDYHEAGLRLNPLGLNLKVL